MKRYTDILIIGLLLFLFSCGVDQEPVIEPIEEDVTTEEVETVMIPGLGQTYNYANQPIPRYINKDNTQSNEITNAGAILGRVLFYDMKLSVNNTIACASCHKQNVAFGDDLMLSPGVNGQTGRHSMRLVNARFSTETRFFWDERASTLEAQTTKPIQDHVEMGFSGSNGDLGIADLIEKLSRERYYKELFSNAFGSELISESRMQDALAQFVRSIQSFDSKFDTGRAMVNNNNAIFPNFTPQENRGKTLFLSPITFQGASGNRIGGGLGCQSCHRAPEFDIDPLSRNNGVTASANFGGVIETNITRSPSLRDLFNQNGTLNGNMMHNGLFGSMDLVLNHYNDIQRVGNNNLDNRLARGGGQNLNITSQEKEDVIAFLKTLTGSDIYNNEKWSNPFSN